MFAIFASHIV